MQEKFELQEKKPEGGNISVWLKLIKTVCDQIAACNKKEPR
jgi:hypothetical protein